MPEDNTVGTRCDQFLAVCECVVDHESLFVEREVDFARNIADKLEQYGHRTFISVAQVNWLNRLEQKCKSEGLL